MSISRDTKGITTQNQACDFAEHRALSQDNYQLFTYKTAFL